MSVFPYPAKAPQGLQWALSQPHHFLNEFKELFNDIFMRSAALPAQLDFRQGWLVLSGNCQYLPNGGQTPEETQPISGIPHPVAGDGLCLCLCACSTCVQPHLKAAVVPIQAACPLRWVRRESPSSWASRSHVQFPTAESPCMHILHTDL